MTMTEMAAIIPNRITNVALERCAEFFLDFAGFFTERDFFILISSNDLLVYLQQDTKQGVRYPIQTIEEPTSF